MWLRMWHFIWVLKMVSVMYVLCIIWALIIYNLNKMAPQYYISIICYLFIYLLLIHFKMPSFITDKPIFIISNLINPLKLIAIQVSCANSSVIYFHYQIGLLLFNHIFIYDKYIWWGDNVYLKTCIFVNISLTYYHIWFGQINRLFDCLNFSFWQFSFYHFKLNFVN